MKKQQHYKAALYCRLSVDDGNFGGSVSIETQKILLEQYCKDHKITDYKFYCDDGCSGTNFDRPSFKKMLSDIDEGKINLVIVKDLSRFGRNYVEAGMYVQRFTDSNIRFIAADDNYDSLVNSDDLLFPIKNVVNEMYARDVSKKTKAAKKAKARDGQFIGSKAPFGYKIDPNDRHHLIVDEPAAQVVKRIFRLASEGVGYNKMAKIFREEKVLTPIVYFNLNNPDYFKSDYWRKEFDWHVTSIRAILNNEVYLGKLVYGKQRNKSMKSKEKVRNPKEDWIVVENCHEPIITQELWDTVHKILNAKHRPAKAGEVQMFAGLLYCSDCGHCLTYSQKQRKDGSYHGAYSCWMYKTHGKEYCASHYITFDTIYELVLIDIQRNLFQYRKNTDKFKSILSRKYQSDSQKQAEQITLEYEQKQKRCEELDKIISRLYEDNVLGRIGDERYESMSQSYELEQVEIKKALPILKSKIDELKRQSDCADNFINVIKKYTIIDKLDAAILNELIDKIVVHHKEQAEDGRTFQQIEIYYRFVGKLTAGNELPEAV
ncbi:MULTISPECIES: recombinase family protein [Ruminococcus]|uniref:recombinase family protein n=1 Tax=Ruminococcus TaxID=1263 RepID=UPI00241C25C0|nr:MULTISPECIES: recombinase family protein [Ruminococcus]MBS6408561.1 recombinase family protein [Ruminococcus bicirculans (ex Wegman et al. 2014)]MEE0561284.1 recombinase family protein [Ruminococcus sp.]